MTGIRLLLVGVLSAGLASFLVSSASAQNGWRGLNAQKCAVANCGGDGSGRRQRNDEPQQSAEDLRLEARAREAKEIKELAEAGNYSAARRAAWRMQEANPEDASWLVGTLHRYVFWPGYQARESKNYLVAIREFRNGIPDWPTNPYGHLALAKSLLEQSRVDFPNLVDARLIEAANELRLAQSYRSSLSSTGQTEISDSVEWETRELNTLVSLKGKYQEANKLYLQQDAAAKSGNYEEALRVALLRQQRGDGDMSNNINWYRNEIEHQRKAKVAASEMREGIQNFTQTLTKSEPKSDLEFADVKTIKTTADDLSSAQRSGKQAAAGFSDEEAKRLSNCAFDYRACAGFEQITFPSASSPSAAVNALAYRLAKDERAMKDEVIKQSFSWFLSLDKEVTETRSKIATIQRQIDSGKGDRSDLEMKKASLQNKMKQYRGDQRLAEKQIKEQAKKLDLSVDWNEQLPAKTNETSRRSDAGANKAASPE
jgi:hypothetical protein